MNAYFAYMFGGMLRRVACRIRPYEIERGQTDRILNKSIAILVDAFEGNGIRRMPWQRSSHISSGSRPDRRSAPRSLFSGISMFVTTA